MSAIGIQTEHWIVTVKTVIDGGDMLEVPTPSIVDESVDEAANVSDLTAVSAQRNSLFNLPDSH